MERKRGWPPKSHSLIVTLPLVTLRMLKPTVGIMSSEKPPVCRTWGVALCRVGGATSDKRRTDFGGVQDEGREKGTATGRARTATTLTSVVLPEFCRPTSVSSISCLKKRLRAITQSSVRYAATAEGSTPRVLTCGSMRAPSQPSPDTRRRQRRGRPSTWCRWS
eukprot:396170-Prymnesium_polylepis.1